MERIDVETTQHVQLQMQPATVFERILAWLIDGFLMGVYIFVVIFLFGFIEELIAPAEFLTRNSWLLVLLVFLPVMFYHLVMEATWNGQSLGKKAIGIRVSKMDGNRATLGDYLMRWIFRIFEISVMAGIVAILTILINGKGQRLGDIAAKTCVIKERKQTGLGHTIFEDVQTGYTPVFQQAIELSDEDITVIKNVLMARHHYAPETWNNMMERTRNLVESKTGGVDKTMQTDTYLRTIIKDYNALHGVVL